MADPSSLDAVSELRNPNNAESQIAALKYLKNKIIGHAEQKEELVRLGIVEALGQTLQNAAKSRGKRKDEEYDGNTQGRGKSLAAHEEARLQAILLLSSLAHGM